MINSKTAKWFLPLLSVIFIIGPSIALINNQIKLRKLSSDLACQKREIVKSISNLNQSAGHSESDLKEIKATLIAVNQRLVLLNEKVNHKIDSLSVLKKEIHVPPKRQESYPSNEIIHNTENDNETSVCLLEKSSAYQHMFSDPDYCNILCVLAHHKNYMCSDCSSRVHHFCSCQQQEKEEIAKEQATRIP